jgi:tetratricopeptide (TPR) repeat protein
MRKQIVIFLMACIATTVMGQQKNAAEKIVDEGVNYHDKGDYEGALKRYDKALELDKDNLKALLEKGYTFFAMKEYKASIKWCNKAIETHPGENGLSLAYITIGTIYDEQKKTDKSIDTYNEGIRIFPNDYQLLFNKGVTLSSVQRYDEALLSFQAALDVKAEHVSSHNAIARISNAANKKVPAILAFIRYLTLDATSSRAVSNAQTLLKLLNTGAKKTGENAISINISEDFLGDTLKSGKPKENSFGRIQLILSMQSALDLSQEYNDKTDLERFIKKMEHLCSSLKGSKQDNFGFFWHYYVPYVVEMQEKNFINTFAYIVFSTTEDEAVKAWIKDHKYELDQFYTWSEAYDWSKK